MTIYARKQWINWDIRIRGRKEIKYPIQGLKSPETWMTYQDAKARGERVGFWLTPEDPYFFLDIDHAYVEGRWGDLSMDLCRRFAGCYTEVSQSREGIHIVGRGVLGPHRCKNSKVGLELYDQDRFIAWTGLNSRGNAEFLMEA